MRVTPIFLAAQILQPFDFRLGENALGQMIFDAGDKHQVAVAAHRGAHEADAAVDHQLRVAAEHRRRRQWRSADVNQRKFQIVFAKDARLLGDPRHRLRHDPRRLHADQTLRRPTPSCRGQTNQQGQTRKQLRRHDVSFLIAPTSARRRADVFVLPSSSTPAPSPDT